MDKYLDTLNKYDVNLNDAEISEEVKQIIADNYEANNTTEVLIQQALDELCKCYSDTEYLSYDDFCVMMSSIGSMNDVYFFVESDNGSLRISSLDTGEQGVFFNQKSLDDARTMLKNSPTNSISFTFENGRQFISQRHIFGRDTERTTKEFKTITIGILSCCR